MKNMIWIGWLGHVHDETGRIGTLVCGPVARGNRVVYVVNSGPGTEPTEYDWKDVLIQLTKGSEVIHFRGDL